MIARLSPLDRALRLSFLPTAASLGASGVGVARTAAISMVAIASPCVLVGGVAAAARWGKR